MPPEDERPAAASPGVPPAKDVEVRQASRAIAWNGILSASVTLFAVAASILTVRLLTKVEYGAYAVATNYLRYASILALFTLDAAILRYVPEFRARGDRRGLINLLQKTLMVQVILWLVLVGATGLASGPLTELNKVDLHTLLYTGIAVVLPSVIYVSLQSVLTSFYEVRLQAVGAVIGGFLQLAALWVFIEVLRWGGPGAILAQTGMSGFLVVYFAWAVARLPYPDQTVEYSPIPLRRLLSFSLPYAITAVLGAVFLRQSEVLFLQPYWGEIATATYSYAYMTAQRLLEFVPAMLYGVGNVLAANAILQSRAHLARVMSIYWRITALAVTAVSIGGFVVADRLVVVLLGEKAAPASFYTSILFLTQALIIFVNPYNFVMRAEEKTWLTFVMSIPAATLSLGLDLLLIPKHGLDGALAATSLSFAGVTVLQYVVFSRVFPYLDVPFGYILRCYAASLPMMLAIPVKNLLPGSYGLLAGLLCASFLWVAGVRALRLVGTDEADLIRRAALPGSQHVLRALAR